MKTLHKHILTLIVIASTAMTQSGRPTVAILDFDGQGVDASDVQTLTERMRTEIGNTNAVRLIERKAVEKLWRSRDFSKQDVPAMNVLLRLDNYWVCSSWLVVLLVAWEKVYHRL